MKLPLAAYTTENMPAVGVWVSLDLINAEQTGDRVGGAGRAVSVEVHTQEAEYHQSVAGAER